MLDECTVERVGESVTAPETGLVTTPTIVIYSGKCKIQTSGGLASENVEGSAAQNMGAVSLAWSLYVHFPWATTGLQSGDLVTVTASQDSTLTGRRYRLISPQSEKSLSTACRWNVKEQA